MIAYIKGKVINVTENSVILENNGIGYEIFCSGALYQTLVNNGEGEAHTYMQVREDGISLYGFKNVEEKDMFLKLITVSGVGPKMGITVLSQLSLNDVALYIATEDIKSLSQVKGLGKKTAERIILELKEKVTSNDLDYTASIPIATASKPNKNESEAVQALLAYGLSKAESERTVKEAIANGATNIEEIITKEFKYL